MLNRLIAPTNPAPTAAAATFWLSLNAVKSTPGASIRRPPKISWSIGEAMPWGGTLVITAAST